MAQTTKRARNGIPIPILLLAGVLVALVGFRLLSPQIARAAVHPDPRPDVTAALVVPADRYAPYPDVSRAYLEAVEIPQILDGLYCHCDCSEHFGHRSLLTCFESDHAAGCDVCLMEADTAYRMHRDGASLQAIRDAIDEMFAES